jgi:hypothetical protein
MKKILLIFILILISGCGFNPIYNQNENSVINQIYKIEKKGDDFINKKILNNLNIITKNNKSNYLFEINSKFKKEGITKDKSNKITNYLMQIDVDININKLNENKIKKTFTSNFTYNNQADKFELLTYEKSIKNDLINKISDEILIYISSINDI